MGIFDFIKNKREENRLANKELEDYKRKLIMEMRLRGEKPVLKRTPEEIELEQYLEEERREKIKNLLAKYRAKRSLFGYWGKPAKFKLGKVW